MFTVVAVFLTAFDGLASCYFLGLFNCFCNIDMHTITIPVKPFVKKFIAARYDQQIWELNKSDRLGKLFYFMLEKMPVRYEKPTLKLGAELTVKICWEYARTRGVYVCANSILEFNDHIKQELVEEIAMYSWKLKNRVGIKKYKELYVKQKTASKQTIRVIKDPDIYQYFEQKEIIYDILLRYGITEDDISFDTIQKSFQRLKLPLLTA